MEKKMSIVMSLVVLALILSPSSAVITCQQAVLKLSPCLQFLVGMGDITPACCLAAQALNAAASTKPDRKAVCECFEKVWNSLHVKTENAGKLPGLCHIELTVPVKPDTDCTKV